MKVSFWHKCWEQSRIGFHQDQVHPFLSQYLFPLINKQDRHVFVPFSGKTLDMRWLAQHMKVSGSELSEIACRDFFSEGNIDSQIKVYQECQSDVKFQQFSSDSITLWQGDFFKLNAKHIISEQNLLIDWIYDRAALIALPIEMQQAYVNHLVSFIGKGTKLFLISVEFPSQEMSGPPFPITEQDIKQLFLSANKHCKIECIASRELENKRFAQRNFEVSHLLERLYIITLP
jgi:thiopurine S-methyltransferase|tara:strand:- start:397 stop:1092 length:696 start_codon:yes stop_codon:yes gene_type:complete